MMRYFLLLLALLVAPPADAQIFSIRPVAGAQHGLSTNAAVGLTIPPTLNAVYATICARGSSVNYTTDGVTVPTATVGTPLGVGSCVGLPGPLLSTFSAFGTGATLDVEYFK
jgi:hypothetical protein